MSRSIFTACVIWECKCECGNVVFKSTSALTRQPLDCGCSNKIDITNRRSGKLVAIRPIDKRKSGNVYWECRCDCGNSKLVLAKYIQSEEVKSCGCLNREPNDQKAVNLTGHRFGRLVVLEKTSKRDRRGRIIWRCQCDCGKMVYASTGILKSNGKKSCGCLLEEAPAIINGTAPYKFIDPKPTAKSATGLQRVRFAGNQKVEKGGTNSMENLAALMSAISPYRITTFFSFTTREETTFNYIATEGVASFKEKCVPLMKQDYSEYIVPCIPNTTIIPKDKSGLILDNKMVLDEDGNVTLSQEKEDVMKMWLEGIYVGAAYGAAGIVAAWQCPEYLKQRFSHTSKEYPGVRFDIEAGDNGLLATTSMTKEISGFTSAIKNSINHTGFGFVFTSDNAQYKGRDIRSVMVYKARNLLSNGSEFEPIYKTLVVTYIERMLRFYSNDFKQDKILSFFSNNPSSQKSKWDASRQYVNSILQDGDELRHECYFSSFGCNRKSFAKKDHRFPI